MGFEEDLPEEARNLPTLNLPGIDLNREDLYILVEGSTCRRCKGTSVDPDGEYPCLLCKGKKIEKFINGNKRFCKNHPDLELINIGKRFVTWEDGQGFDHSGYLAVMGCPVCKVPAYSVMWG